MTDIYDIKGILFFLPRLNTDTWYVIGICIGIYCIHIFYLVLSERYRKMQVGSRSLEIEENLSEIFARKIEAIDPEDGGFFLKISSMVREYLERTGMVENASKRTTEEINKEMDSPDLNALLSTSREHEYAIIASSIPERQKLKSLAIQFVREPFHKQR